VAQFPRNLANHGVVGPGAVLNAKAKKAATPRKLHPNVRWHPKFTGTQVRQHVVFMKRPGGQSQFSTRLEAQITGKNTFAKLHEWAIERLGDRNLNVDLLAAHAGMNPRNFARVYTATTGRTPSKAIEFLRLEEARRLLEDTDKSIDEISDKIGLGSTERMRTSFQRNLKVSPRDYRLRFGYAS